MLQPAHRLKDMNRRYRIVAVAMLAAAACDATQQQTPDANQQAQSIGTQVTLAAIGDLLLHSRVQFGAAEISQDPQKSDEMATIRQELDTLYGNTVPIGDLAIATGYSYLFNEVRNALSLPDITFANLETPLARDTGPTWNCADRVVNTTKTPVDNYVYAGFGEVDRPEFNAHPGFALALKHVGIDVVSTANNHALDRCQVGVDRTLDAVQAAGLAAVGTARRADAESAFPPENRRYIKTVKGVKFAFVAYTYGTNVRYNDNHQVSVFKKAEYIDGITASDPSQPAPEVLANILADIDELRKKVDFIIVSLHWGSEYKYGQTVAQYKQQQWQQTMAHALLNRGADVILGHHPHVVHQIEKFNALDGRKTYVIYSLGNFLSGQEWQIQRDSLIFYLKFYKFGQTKWIDNAAYMPINIVSKPMIRGNVYMPTPVNDAPHALKVDDKVTTRLRDLFSHGGMDVSGLTEILTY